MATRYQLAAVIALVIVFSVAVTFDLSSAKSPPATPMTPVKTVDTCDTKMSFNGTQYCSLDVYEFTTFWNPGYFMMNESFKFNGVLFQSVCQDDLGNCGTGPTKTMVFIDLMMLNMTFGDGSHETLFSIVGDSCFTTPLLTQQHLTPLAGFYLYCVPGSPTHEFKLFLLVEAAQ